MLLLKLQEKNFLILRICPYKYRGLLGHITVYWIQIQLRFFLSLFLTFYNVLTILQAIVRWLLRCAKWLLGYSISDILICGPDPSFKVKVYGIFLSIR